MSGPLTTSPLAAVVQRPLAFAVLTAGLGAATYLVALALPVGAFGLALAVLGALAGVAGALTAAVVVLARATGIAARSERAVVEGRQHMLFPGSRPPVMYLRPRQRVIDLTDSPAPAPVEQLPAPADR